MNINTPTFYLSARRVTRVTTLAEATSLAMRMENPRNILLLSPEAGDQSDQVSDCDELVQDMDSAFEPARTLEVEEDVLVDDISRASVFTSNAAVDDISGSNDDFSNTKPTRRRKKSNITETAEKSGYT